MTGRARGRDVDRGRTTVRSRAFRLPDDATATLRLRYWVGMSSVAPGRSTGSGSAWSTPATATSSPRALSVDGDGRSHRPRWRSLAFRIPSELRGERVAIELVAVDAGRDATVEAGSGRRADHGERTADASAVRHRAGSGRHGSAGAADRPVERLGCGAPDRWRSRSSQSPDGRASRRPPHRRIACGGTGSHRWPSSRP